MTLVSVDSVSRDGPAPPACIRVAKFEQTDTLSNEKESQEGIGGVVLMWSLSHRNSFRGKAT